MPRVKLFNKEIVLQKAMELFWKKGYHATSIQDMVSHLGINRASLYDTFGGKKNLFDESLELYCKTNKEGTLDFLKNEKSVKSGLRKLLEMAVSDSIKDIDHKGCFVVNTTTELIPGNDETKKALINNRSIFEKIFYNFLLSGQKNGEIAKNKDLKAISSLIYTLLSGLKVVAKIEPDRKKLLSSVNTILTILD